MVSLSEAIPVLVTRPDAQSRQLCDLITGAGGRYFRFPVLEIADSHKPEELQEAIRQLDSFDIAIFISANAVERVLLPLQASRVWPQAVAIAVIGKRSAEEVARFGLAVDLCPEHQFDSDGLLALPELQLITNKKIIIFRGNGGRDYLANQLHDRGAEVCYVEAYQRRRPMDSDVEALKRFLQQDKCIITAYSNESLQNLMGMVDDQTRDILRAQLLVVVSSRIKPLVSKLGFGLEPVVARSALDEDVLLAIATAQQQM